MTPRSTRPASPMMNQEGRGIGQTTNAAGGYGSAGLPQSMGGYSPGSEMTPLGNVGFSPSGTSFGGQAPLQSMGAAPQAPWVPPANTSTGAPRVPGMQTGGVDPAVGMRGNPGQQPPMTGGGVTGNYGNTGINGGHVIGDPMWMGGGQPRVIGDPSGMGRRLAQALRGGGGG